MAKKSVVIMGTPEFAVASLDALVNEGIEVKAVISAPDKQAGRGKKLRSSAMSQRALELGIPTLKPTKLKDADFLKELQAINADLFVVVAFRMLPELVWAMPPLGTINLHGSILPNYRGAAPINRAIMNGETKTGATTFFIQQAIDTGDIIDRIELSIGDNETAGELHDRMKDEGAALLVRTVQAIFSGEASSKPQAEFAESELRDAPKIHTDDRRIDWSRSAKEVHDLIRGLSPYPAAWTELRVAEERNMKFKVLLSALGSHKGLEPGQIVVEEDRLFVQCADACVEILRLQPEGKKAMDTSSYVRGARLPENPQFE